MSSETRTPDPSFATGKETGRSASFPPPHIDELLESEVFKPGGTELARFGKGRGDKDCAPTPPAIALKGGQYISYDFGREVVGYPVLKVRSGQGGVLDIGYSETLKEGKVDPHRNGVRYADRFILKPGVQEIETFDKRAFRYMQVDVRDCPGEVVIESIGLRFSTYPVKWRGSFESSDATLDEIWKLSAYTVQLNMEDGYTDCPWRERAQWWGDARVEALINYYAFGDLELVRKGLRDIAHSQRIDGITNCFAPGDLGPCTPIPSFTLIWILSMWDYYMWSGDRALVEELYPNVKKAIGFFEAHSDSTGLAKDLPYWMFIDWENMDVRGTVTALNCFYYAALLDAARMAKMLGEAEDAQKYEQLADRVKTSINELLFDKRRGVYSDCLADGKQSEVVSQQANSLAVLYGIAPTDAVERILDYIHDPSKKVVPAGSPYFSFYVLQALWRAGREKQALSYIRERWGEMLKAGATTCWEVWNQNASLCHGWSGGPAHDLGAHVLGVRPIEPGFSKLLVSPNLGDLGYARGTIPSPKGDISVEARRAKGLTLTVSVPQGSQARVVLPDAVPLEEVQVSGPAPVSKDRDEKGRPVFEVREGRYVFICGGKTHEI